MREITRREAEMSRVESIRLEMSDAVRDLGEGGINAKDNIRIAARKIGLTASVVERLLYKKIKRPAADIVDAVRDAVGVLEKARKKRENHQAFIIEQRVSELERKAEAEREQRQTAQRLAIIEQRLAAIDPDFHCEQIDQLRDLRDRMGGRSQRAV